MSRRADRILACADDDTRLRLRGKLATLSRNQEGARRAAFAANWAMVRATRNWIKSTSTDAGYMLHARAVLRSRIERMRDLNARLHG